MTFFVEGKPIGKQSVRVANRHSFIPKKTRDYMNKVAAAFKLCNAELITGPVELIISEYRERPKYHYGTGRNSDKIKDRYQQVFCVTKPDISNTKKAIEDALNGLAWIDDSYVVDSRHHKRYANKGERIGAFVTIKEAIWHDDSHVLSAEHRQDIAPIDTAPASC